MPAAAVGGEGNLAAAVASAVPGGRGSGRGGCRGRKQKIVEEKIAIRIQDIFNSFEKSAVIET